MSNSLKNIFLLQKISDTLQTNKKHNYTSDYLDNLFFKILDKESPQTQTNPSDNPSDNLSDNPSDNPLDNLSDNLSINQLSIFDLRKKFFHSLEYQPSSESIENSTKTLVETCKNFSEDFVSDLNKIESFLFLADLCKTNFLLCNKNKIFSSACVYQNFEFHTDNSPDWLNAMQIIDNLSLHLHYEIMCWLYSIYKQTNTNPIFLLEIMIGSVFLTILENSEKTQQAQSIRSVCSAQSVQQQVQSIRLVRSAPCVQQQEHSIDLDLNLDLNLNSNLDLKLAIFRTCLQVTTSFQKVTKKISGRFYSNLICKNPDEFIRYCQLDYNGKTFLKYVRDFYKSNST